MIETEISNKKTASVEPLDLKRVEELEAWFKDVYVKELLRISRYKYLGLPCDRTKYDLEKEAYQKENELRKLLGQEELPAIKYKKIL